MTALPCPAVIAGRCAHVAVFVRARYGLRGTWALHRHALGLDLLRAPVNVALSPLFLILRLLAAGMGIVGLRRAGRWLAARHIFLTSDLARRIGRDLSDLVIRMDADGTAPRARPDRIASAIRAHVETRNAVAEITTSLIVLAAGLIWFHSPTPGVISLAGPVAEMRAQAAAIDGFLLGQGMGRMWYGMFPVALSPGRIIATGIVLAVLGSLVTTFAGLIADPVQRATGIHRRRLMRMLARLDHPDAEDRLEREHLLARVGDLSDAALGLWRGLR